MGSSDLESLDKAGVQDPYIQTQSRAAGAGRKYFLTFTRGAGEGREGSTLGEIVGAAKLEGG